MGILNFARTVGNIARKKMLQRECFLGFHDHVGDMILPLHSDTSIVGFITNFIIEVVEILQVSDDFPCHCILNCQYGTFSYGIYFRPAHSSNSVDVVCYLERTHIPQLFFIKGAKQTNLDHHTTLAGLNNKIPQASEMSVIPGIQVKLISTPGIPWRGTSSPDATESV